jgi:flagellar motor protein MotB
VVAKGQIEPKKIRVIGLSSNFPISKVRSENRRVEISFKIKS